MGQGGFSVPATGSISPFISAFSRTRAGRATSTRSAGRREDPYEPIKRLCKPANLPYGHKLSASTPDMVVFRTSAAFISTAVFGRDRWACQA
jgi:hypothetical protein